MVKSDSVIEIEVDSKLNHHLSFPPLGRRIRGRFDINSIAEPKAKLKSNEWPEPIPGQRIGYDLATGVGYVLEPLHDKQYALARKRIESRGHRIAEAREETKAAHRPTWLFWMKRAVESGCAVVTSGAFPSDLAGEPRKSFITQPRRSAEDRLVAAIERQNELLIQVLATLKK